MINLTRIQTKNLSITTTPKIASRNLINFFGRFDNIIETDYETDDNNIPNIIIVITRNERERWCSGVIQNLNDNIDTMYEGNKNVTYILDKAANSLGNNSVFTSGNNPRSTLGILGYTSCITELALRDNTHFTDISSLNKKSFWEKVCEMDNTWPHVNEWWIDWNNFSNEIHGPPSTTNLEHNKRKKLVSIVEDMLNNDRRLDFISTTLNSNQETINYLKGTDKWIK